MSRSNFKFWFAVLFCGVLGIALAWGFVLRPKNGKLRAGQNQPLSQALGRDAGQAPNATRAQGMENPVSKPQLLPPLDRALERVTKKPFGIKISPASSPVSPERFSGYHTGVDFETFPEEQDADVAVYAVCEGALLEKRFVSGYGGVAVQSCRLNSQDITVVYGHLKLASISVQAGEKLASGSRLGLLGKGYSVETDGERKHLHLGIHLGKQASLLGYVKTSAGLDEWFDAMKYLK